MNHLSTGVCFFRPVGFINARLCCLFVISVLTIQVLVTTHSLQAHTRSESFSKWRLISDDSGNYTEESIEAVLTMKLETALKMDWTAANDTSFEQAFLDHTLKNIHLTADGNPCTLSGEPKISVSGRIGYIRLEWRNRCPRESVLEIENNAYFAKVPNHTHIARITIEDGPIVENLFTNRERHWTIRSTADNASGLDTAGPAGSSFLNYFAIGLEHILSGWDHLAFILALLLLCGSVRDVFVLVTGFTIGHSITLGLGVLGIINPDTRAVEALIGFTIALAAAEKAGKTTDIGPLLGLSAGIALFAAAAAGFLFSFQGPPPLTLVGIGLFTFCYLNLISRTGDGGARFRPAVTLFFGLIHGFGFSGSLAEIGLPTDRFVAALLGFNLGVEAGQLVVVFVLWGTAGMFMKTVPVLKYQLEQRITTDAITAGLFGLGLFWFISRAYS